MLARIQGGRYWRPIAARAHAAMKVSASDVVAKVIATPGETRTLRVSYLEDETRGLAAEEAAARGAGAGALSDPGRGGAAWYRCGCRRRSS